MDQTIVLPVEISQGIDGFLNDAKQAFGDALVSAVLFGSAAEGRLRSTSDVNLLLVLKRFDKGHADLIRDSFRAAHAAMRLDVMFILKSELGPAMDAFAVKFSDIISRRRILFGPDPFTTLVITPQAILNRTKQVLINLTLRLRERYVLISLREEQLAFIIADAAGPLRACSATLMKLQGIPVTSPKEAMATMISELNIPNGPEVLNHIDMVRSQGALPPGAAGTLLFSLIELAEKMYGIASGLFECGAGGEHG